MWHGNHYYEVLNDKSRSWQDAHDVARVRTYRGWFRGYLSYLETSEENSFVKDLAFASPNKQHWLGLKSLGDADYKVTNTMETKEGRGRVWCTVCLS